MEKRASSNSFIPPIFGFIQRDLIYKIFKKPLRIGVDHPKREVSEFFFRSLNEAIKNNFISRNEMLRFIDKGYVSKTYSIFGQITYKLKYSISYQL